MIEGTRDFIGLQAPPTCVLEGGKAWRESEVEVVVGSLVDVDWLVGGANDVVDHPIGEGLVVLWEGVNKCRCSKRQ